MSEYNMSKMYERLMWIMLGLKKTDNDFNGKISEEKEIEYVYAAYMGDEKSAEEYSKILDTKDYLKDYKDIKYCLDYSMINIYSFENVYNRINQFNEIFPNVLSPELVSEIISFRNNYWNYIDLNNKDAYSIEYLVDGHVPYAEKYLYESYYKLDKLANRFGKNEFYHLTALEYIYLFLEKDVFSRIRDFDYDPIEKKETTKIEKIKKCLDYCIKSFEYLKDIDVSKINLGNKGNNVIINYYFKPLYKFLLGDNTFNHGSSVLELLIRKYVELMIDANYDSKYREHIYSYLKKSALFKLSNDKEKLIISIINEAKLYVEDLPGYKLNILDNLQGENSKIVLEHIKDYNLNLYKKNRDKYQYLLYFNDYIFKILKWLYINPNDEFVDMVKTLEYYLEVFRIPNERFNYKFNNLLYLKTYYESSSNKDDAEYDYENKILETINKFKYDENRVLENMKDIDLDMHLIQSLKPLGEEWYKEIIQGEYIFEMINKIEGMQDYTPSIICWCNCIESMLKERVYSKLSNTRNDYLEDKLQKNDKEFTLGTIPFLCKYSKDNYDESITKEVYELAGFNKKYSLNEFKRFIDNINCLNRNYRVPTAHPGIVGISRASDCKRLIFISAKIIKVLSSI